MTNDVEMRIMNLENTMRTEMDDLKKELRVKNALEVLKMAKEYNLISPETYKNELKMAFGMYFDKRLLDD